MPVQSVRLDNWKEAELEEMRRTGNTRRNELVLARVTTDPIARFFRGPRLGEDGAEIREQWIRAKYERRELQGGASPLLMVLEQPVPLLESWAVKRGAKRKSWKRRHMELLGTRLSYYAKRGDAQPKGGLGLREVQSVEVSVQGGR